MQSPLLQAEYWRSRTERDGAFVEYGNDVEGSAFSIRDPLGSTRWNLQVSGYLEVRLELRLAAGLLLCCKHTCTHL